MNGHYYATFPFGQSLVVAQDYSAATNIIPGNPLWLPKIIPQRPTLSQPIPCVCPRLSSPHGLTTSPQRRKGIQRRWNPIHRGRASFPQRRNVNLQRLNPYSTETIFKLTRKECKVRRGWILSCSLGTLDYSLNIQTFIEWLQFQTAVKVILHEGVLSLHRVIAKLQAGDTSLRPWKASLQWK